MFHFFSCQRGSCLVFFEEGNHITSSPTENIVVCVIKMSWGKECRYALAEASRQAGGWTEVKQMILVSD